MTGGSFYQWADVSGADVRGGGCYQADQGRFRCRVSTDLDTLDPPALRLRDYADVGSKTPEENVDTAIETVSRPFEGFFIKLHGIMTLGTPNSPFCWLWVKPDDTVEEWVVDDIPRCRVTMGHAA